MNGNTTCRWGFLSAAAIAKKNWKAIRVSGNGTVTAVASRSQSRAEAFVQQCGEEVPMANDVAVVEGYDALLERDDVDAVYIPLPTGVRKEWVIKAAQAGKHVLCEKPVAINAEDAQAMIQACEDAGVQFMDGVMFDHSARMGQLRQAIRDTDTFGKLRRIQTHFSFCGDDAFEASNIRAQAELEPHGCLGDLGWYCIRFSLGMLDGRLPKQVSARILNRIGAAPNSSASSHSGVPAALSAELVFDDDISAGFYCSFLSSNQQTAILSGERGHITLEDFVLPLRSGQSTWQQHQHELEIDNCRWNFYRRSTSHGIDEYDSGEHNAQEVNMVRELSSIALSGNLDPKYPKISLHTQLVLDACRLSDAHGGKPVEL